MLSYANRRGRWLPYLTLGCFLCVTAQAPAANDYRFDRADYGQRIAGVTGDVAVWWCEATWKVAQQRAVPETAAPAAALSAARNDFEAVQVVVRPTKDLRQLTAAVSELTGPNGVKIPAKNVQVLRVYYHFVHTPTDRTGVRDWWPDALPPLDKPLDVAAGKNQPLWVLVHVPADAAAGDYTGVVTLTADGWTAQTPIQLHVWNFALPKRNHLETAFGLGMDSNLHRLKTEADQRREWDMYFQAFADHRISPYNPTPMDPLKIDFDLKAKPPRAKLDFTAFDRAMTRAVNKFHFTNFVLPMAGMGGGTYQGRTEPSIGPYGENTPEYQAAFASQVKQLESHLREKGWLKMAYTYWFDEPAPKDYPFVQAGMDRIKKYAPGIQTMITTHMQDDALRAVDIWCPNTPRYKEETAVKRQARGERYWSYLCTGPKAPLCTLFIDHPATDMRVWLWQSWQRKMVGILVWATTYWGSHGDVAQNPYEDPMGYVGGTRPEEKKYWGNGDGRLLYPPLAIAFPDKTKPGAGPILAPPVSCIRLEMLREGIEDYEFLWLLRDLITQKRGSLSAEQVKNYEALLEVPAEITSSMMSYTTDPRPIYARRAAIAAAIEQLSK